MPVLAYTRRVWAGWGIVAAVVAGCGRVAFEAVPRDDDGGGGSGTDGDSAMMDVAPQVCSSCASLISTYLFEETTDLGLDAIGPNHMRQMVTGTPTQSTDVPSGLGGHSVSLDGSSSFCITSAFTFDSGADSTLCWWSKPTIVPADNASQFSQFCSYDSWAAVGTSYRWTVNNCITTGTQSHFYVPNIHVVGQWTQICQTYERATLTRRVRIAGQTSTQVDSFPVDDPTSRWCIGSFGTNGYWTGLIYRPMWFERVLSDTEIDELYPRSCCVP